LLAVVPTVPATSISLEKAIGPRKFVLLELADWFHVLALQLGSFQAVIRSSN